ncbi:Pentatricopeptide repeat-containing protein [Artemisia annua]|uniref:Pentatricopeptide repeat-containing protein n=1 Tax=Artemisia annua TaxID=35608 RepID=A0A2U1N4L8_ARTAN|nr:Pentatricopeptide repeat-containing protein [Artemisia annua]
MECHKPNMHEQDKMKIDKMRNEIDSCWEDLSAEKEMGKQRLLILFQKNDHFHPVFLLYKAVWILICMTGHCKYGAVPVKSQGPNIGATSSHGNAERRCCMSQGASSSCNLRRAVFEMLKEQPFYQPKAGTYMKLIVPVKSQGPNIGATSSHGNAERRCCMSQGASSSCNLRRAVFEMLKEQPFYQPKAGTYMKLIVQLRRSGQPQHAQNLFSMMIEEGLEPIAELYTALLAYCLVGSAYQHCEDDSHSFINAFGNVADTASAGTEHYYTKDLRATHYSSLTIKSKRGPHKVLPKLNVKD